MEKVRCLILGGGPAGYTAAIYAARANLAPVLYEGMMPGGQLTTTTVVENYPGFENGVDANTLMASMRAQAISFGADIRMGTATAADLSQRPFRIVIDGDSAGPAASLANDPTAGLAIAAPSAATGTVILAETLIIATGATAKYLGLPSEAKYRGMGDLRRILLPQEDGRRGRRWRYGLRRGAVSFRPGEESVHDRPAGCLPGLQGHAGQGVRDGEHRDSLELQHAGGAGK